MLDKLQNIVYIQKLHTLLQYFQNFFYIKTIIYEKDLTAPIIQIYPKIKVKVQPHSSTGIKKIVTKHQERLDSGHLCFVAENEDSLTIGYGWVAFDEIYVSEIDKTIKLRSEEACIYDCFVFREYRRQKVYQKMLETICRHLRNREFKKVYIGVLSNNIPSKRGIQRVGFHEKGIVTVFKFLGFRKYSEEWNSEPICWKVN